MHVSASVLALVMEMRALQVSAAVQTLADLNTDLLLDAFDR